MAHKVMRIKTSFFEWLVEEKGKFEVSVSQMDALTDDILKYAKKVLNSKGYNAYYSNKASATVEWAWFKGNPLEKRPPGDAPRFTLSGWHGSGSYGKGKVILNVFISNVEDYNFSEVAKWEFPFSQDTAVYSNRFGTAYTVEALDSYKEFLKEVKKQIDEAPKP